MAAFPPVTRDGLDEEQRRLWDELTLGPRGFYTGGPETRRLPDLYNAWIQFPEFGTLMLRLGDTVRGAGALSGKLREMVVLVVSARLGAMVEFDFHVPFACNEGWPDEAIAAMRAGTAPAFAAEVEALAHAAILELLDTATLAPQTQAGLVAAIGHPGVVQLMACVMLYVVTAWTSNVARVQLAEDFSVDPEQLARFFAGQPPSGAVGA